MTAVRSHYDVAIVGGGISGLAAAWTLQQNNPQVNYALLESSSRWGGKILTDELTVGQHEPFIVEGGPDSFLTQKPWALQLAQSLGMSDRLLPTNDGQRRVYVLNRGRLVPLPAGVMLIVPTKLTPFVLSPLISLPGKLRMGLDWFIRPKTGDTDETLAEFITRRLGSEALDKIAEPLLAGIYNAEAERQSVLATFPHFRAIEEKHGSLIRGMLAAKKMRTQLPSGNGQGSQSAFLSFRTGMNELVEGLLARLNGSFHLDAIVTGLARQDTGYILSLGNGQALTASAVILAVPAYAAASLLKTISASAAVELKAIRYVSTGTISLAYRRDTIDHPLDGFGIVIPRSERRQINAITWTSTKFNHRAPASHVLLRVFFGGSRTPLMMEVNDKELVDVVRVELQAIMGIEATPVMYRIYRWFKASPQYDVGHLERITKIETALKAGIFLAGSAYRGIGIPDCIRQGSEAAEKASAYLLTGSERLKETRRD